ncbi:CbiQ family ECF transporter T component [Chitinilyticum piscinae]|uniref:Cobalt transport protein n=1 Tax=Chitinilyticum piscinae TaxID=2866724 RepID=A0A8J7FKV3_9NEIS|nr:CbiQ family ECF transporter T component [Chitinilyticum piscinae]MBE9609627.1 hypothetical protein [Chitinilyticum piscinae]
MHAVNILALWFWLAVMLAGLGRQSLYMLVALVLLAALLLLRERLFKALRRMKWLLLAVVLVYGWSTPGWYLWTGGFAPTREGLVLGLEQALRLLALVAGLQFVLARLDRPALFGALFQLAWPLQWLLNRERLAVRLALTLDFTDRLLEERRSFSALLDEFVSPAPPVAGDQGWVDFPLCPLRRKDSGLLLLLVCAIMATCFFLGTLSWP